MSKKHYPLIFTVAILLIIVSADGISRLRADSAANSPARVSDAGELTVLGASLSDARALATDRTPLPKRNWSVPDPSVSAKAVIIQSLENRFPYFHYNTYAVWPAASLTKLLTAAAVTENINLNEKITVSDRAAGTPGSIAGLRSGEVYTARDLLSILLIGSSNDAAVTFEDYLGRDEFTRLVNKTASEIGMARSIFHDGSGLSDLNQVTANDIAELVRYLISRHPDILERTRIPVFTVQPVNSLETRTITNVNPLVGDSSFLGGKTGTSAAAGENIAAVMTLNGERVAVVVLGSRDRVAETKKIFDWIHSAYNL